LRLYLKYPLTYDKNAFADIEDVNENYFIQVLGAKELGLMVGDENGCFNPKSNLTRAEVATIVKRLRNLNQ
jgi:hypothetical protein